MKSHNNIEAIEAAWDAPDGVLYKLRQGLYDQAGCEALLAEIQAIDFGTTDVIDRRTVAVLWYMPIFLEWQAERVAENGGDLEAFQQFATSVLNALEEVLGVP